ncbi:hypothetical protein OOU_Y34scaffold00306g3 [Pyricularia oryzae Y34]|uniref:Uncharacterized protein n=2 Tax=Pyricularia oryzae TaxID=318829 RepID=A0AA97P329_PYRO3|nr:hypothetical protein OOU_Y34scaffold00306g3 [Pyricularia oryzae Y34]
MVPVVLAKTTTEFGYAQKAGDIPDRTAVVCVCCAKGEIS